MKSNSVRCDLYLAEELPQYQKEQFLLILHAHGFTSYNVHESRLDNISDLVKKGLANSIRILRYKKHDAAISFIEDFINIAMDSDPDSTVLEAVVDDFAKQFNNIRFAFIDDSGDAPKGLEKLIKNSSLNWLFKVNYFGEDYINQYGFDFFNNFPSVNQLLIGKTIIRLNLTDSLTNTINAETKERATKYLQQAKVKAKVYDFSKFYYK